MTEPAPEPDLGRLIKLLELLRSDQPGEVVATAHAVVRFLDAHALTWGELLTPEALLPAVVSVEVGGGPVGPPVGPQGPPPPWQQAANPFQAPWGQAQQAAMAQAQMQAAMNAQQAMNAYASQGLSGGTFTGPLHMPARTWRDAARDCVATVASPARLMLRPKELDFVQQLLGRSYPTLTPKQEAWLRDICARCGVDPW